MTSDIRQIVNGKLELVSSKQLITTYNKAQLTPLEIRERSLMIASGLTIAQWVGWYCKGFKLLGEGRYTALATMARAGRDPKNLFSRLLREEMDARLAK